MAADSFEHPPGSTSQVGVAVTGCAGRRAVHPALDDDFIAAAIMAGQRVYVHCWGGIGRTGTTVGCCLVRHGLTGDQALAAIARLRQGTLAAYHASPETHA